MDVERGLRPRYSVRVGTVNSCPETGPTMFKRCGEGPRCKPFLGRNCGEDDERAVLLLRDLDCDVSGPVVSGDPLTQLVEPMCCTHQTIDLS